MTSDKIKKVSAYEVLDSRGFPTVACVVTTRNHHEGKAMVPSGASTGVHEALELRDNNSKRYNGKGVLGAISNIENKIAAKVKNLVVSSQRKVDETMLRLDGTKNKSKLGANAMLGVSLAVAQANALSQHAPLYESLNPSKKYILPLPLFNVINGGAHADSGLSVQEFKIIPVGATTFKKALEMGCEVFQALKQDIANKGMSVAVGDEGGFAPKIGTSENALRLIVKAIKDAGYKLEKDFAIGLDVAASEFYKNGVYHFEGKKCTSDQLARMYESWIKRFPIVSIEDPFEQDDWDAWKKFTLKNGMNLQIIGDDLTVTNPKRLRRAIFEQACNALIIKPNQIGTLTETIEVIQMAQAAGFGTIMSHRSGETIDTAISDIAVAFGTGQIKAGSLSRGERLCKYNRILEIERELGPKAKLAKTRLHEILR
jgi:enolase